MFGWNDQPVEASSLPPISKLKLRTFYLARMPAIRSVPRTAIGVSLASIPGCRSKAEYVAWLI